MSDKRQFTPLEKKIIHELQQDLPVVRRPFAAVAERVGISEAELLDKVREFIADDIIRRFGATLRHQRSGFDANAMVVWEVEPERAEEVGNIFLRSVKSPTVTSDLQCLIGLTGCLP